MAPRTCAFDVAVVGGGPAGIGAALAASKTGAKTVLVERDARLGGTTVSAEVLPIGLFHAWNRQVIAGPCWDLVTNAVDLAGGVLPDFPKLDARDWRSHCVKVNPFIYSALAAETLEKAGVELWFNAAACGIERTADGWKIALATDEGMRHLTAKEVVDATGNASVAAFAGAKRVRADDAERQPGSYFFHLNTRGMTFDAEVVDKAHAAAVASGELLPTDIHIKMSKYIRAGGGWGCYVPLAAATKLPVIIQTYNGKSPMPSAKVLVDLAKRHPDTYGWYKVEGTGGGIVPCARELVAAKPVVKTVFTGWGGRDWLYHYRRVGSRGVISQRPMYADLMVKTWKALESGDPAADELFAKFMYLRNLDNVLPAPEMRGWNLYVLKKRGVFRNTLSRTKKRADGRWEVADVALSEEDKSEIDARLKYAIGDISKQGK